MGLSGRSGAGASRGLKYGPCKTLKDHCARIFAGSGSPYANKGRGVRWRGHVSGRKIADELADLIAELQNLGHLLGRGWPDNGLGGDALVPAEGMHGPAADVRAQQHAVTADDSR